MAPEDKEVKRFGNGWLKILKGIHIVSVKGSDYERGMQYGKLRRGCGRYF